MPRLTMEASYEAPHATPTVAMDTTPQSAAPASSDGMVATSSGATSVAHDPNAALLKDLEGCSPRRPLRPPHHMNHTVTDRTPVVPDPTPVQNVTMTDVMKASMVACKSVMRRLRTYVGKPKGTKFIPPTDRKHYLIAGYKERTFVVAAIKAKNFWWKAEPTIAAVGGLKASQVRHIDVEEIGDADEDDFWARDGKAYQEAMKDPNADVAHFRVSLELDWNYILGQADYSEIESEKEWRGMVAGVEDALVLALKAKLGMPRVNDLRGLIDLSAITCTAPQLQPSGNFYVYLQRPRGGNVPKGLWNPYSNKIYFQY